MAVADPNEVSLLEQVNTALGSWCELPTWQMPFPQECEDHQKPEAEAFSFASGDISSLASCHHIGHRELYLNSPHSVTSRK